MQENRAGGIVVPVLIGAAIAGGLLLWANSSKASTPPSAPAPGPLPSGMKCTVTQAKLTQWGATAGIAAFHTPMIGIEDPITASLAFDILPSEIGNKINALPSSTSVVLVDKNDVFHYFANDTTPSVRRDDLYADYCSKVGGTVAGHPLDLFMF